MIHRTGFRRLLSQLADSWLNDRDQIEEQAAELDRVIQTMNTIQKDNDHPRQLITHYQQVMASITQSYDTEYGGFGDAPKFPPYNQLRLLLDEASEDSLNMVDHTLKNMALSGLYDSVNGGFHRYSTDYWHCPHFENVGG